MKKVLVSLFVLCFIYSCISDNAENIPDVSHIEENHRLIRFEQELFNLDSTKNILEEFDQLIKKYPSFSELYFKEILPIQATEASLKDALSNKSLTFLIDTTHQIFGDFKDIEEDFSKTFKYYLHYFPEATCPDIYTFISEFSYQRFLFESEDGRDGIGIGLDLFMGEDFPYKKIDPMNPSFSAYLTRSFNKEHLVKKSMELFIEDKMGFPKGNRMLDHMIHNGKKLYILDRLMPFVQDSVIMEYSKEQMEWVNDNELEMWAFFFKEKLFYESNGSKINKYINPSPNSPKMPEKAPGMTGNFLGWKIVEAYMEKNPELSLTDLINISDAQEILDQSKYKPKK